MQKYNDIVPSYKTFNSLALTGGIRSHGAPIIDTFDAIPDVASKNVGFDAGIPFTTCYL